MLSNQIDTSDVKFLIYKYRAFNFLKFERFLQPMLLHCTFNPELFVLSFEVIFCGVTVNSTFRKRVSKISFVFSMYYLLKSIINESTIPVNKFLDSII